MALESHYKQQLQCLLLLCHFRVGRGGCSLGVSESQQNQQLGDNHTSLEVQLGILLQKISGSFSSTDQLQHTLKHWFSWNCPKSFVENWAHWQTQRQHLDVFGNDVLKKIIGCFGL